MTKDQEDILNMYQSTDDVLQKPEHAPIWAANVPFDAAVTELEDNIDKIEEQRDIQGEDTTGITDDKQNKRKSLEDQTFTAGSIIVFYASAVNNRKLLKKVNFTRSELRDARDNELPGMSEQVHQEAVANAAAVLPYGLTGAMTTDLDTAKNDFVEFISKPRAAKSETSAATEQLPKIYIDTNTLLEERIDKGMELYRVSNPGFYTEYFNARIIVNSPTLKRALEIHFEDENGSALEHVKVLVDGNINRRSSSKGNIRVQTLTEGAHAFTASLPGFNPVSQNFNVVAGETTKIALRMVRV